jgi:hypothetical protein
VTAVEKLHRNLTKDLHDICEVLAQRQRVTPANIQERVDLDRSLAYTLRNLLRDLKATWTELAGGFLHHPIIIKLVNDNRTPEVASLHRAAIRIEEFYQGKKSIATGFLPLRNIIRILQQQARQRDGTHAAPLEQALQTEIASLHDYFQSYRNDAFMLIKQQAPELLDIQGVGNDEPHYVLTNIAAWYTAFLSGVRRLMPTKRSKKRVLTAVLMGTMALVSAREAAKQFTPPETAAQASIELKRDGITADQRLTYIPGINNLIYRGTLPYGYDIKLALKMLIPNILNGRMGNIQQEKTGKEMASPAREDAWRLYLGLPQEHDTFAISHDVPDGNHAQYSYKINGWFNNFFSKQPYATPAEFIKAYSESLTRGERPIWQDEEDIMGGYTLRIGHDAKGTYLYYYDVWDLAVPLEREVYLPGTKILIKKGGFIGKPLIIHDRLYFNPATFEPLEPLSIHRAAPSVSNTGAM